MPDVLPPPSLAPSNTGAAPGPSLTAGGAPAKPAGNQEFAFKRLVEKGTQLEGRLQAALEEIAELRGRVSASPSPQSQSTPHSWAEMSDEQLSQAMQLAVKEQNSAALDAIVNERIDRKVRTKGEEVSKNSIQEMERRQLGDAIRAKIVNDFGQDAINPDSQLHGLADRHFGSLANLYGKDEVLTKPHFQLLAFLMAHRELHANDSEMHTQTQRELDKLRRQLQLERGSISPGVRTTPESAEALGKGDIKGAILGTSLFKSINEEHRRKYGS